MTEQTQATLNELAAKAFRLIAPFLVGALVTMWLTSARDHAQVETNTKAIVALQQDVKEVRDNYATNKRVDDLAAEMRSGFTNLDAKIDQILKLMIQRR
jgi:soluble cytochrome b562